jgi:hypothetical protein
LFLPLYNRQLTYSLKSIVCALNDPKTLILAFTQYTALTRPSAKSQNKLHREIFDII